MKSQKVLKLLEKEYNKKIDVIDILQHPLDAFVAALEFRRNYLTLTQVNFTDEDNKNIPLVSLNMALKAYYNFKTCINKYYNIMEDGMVLQKDKEKTAEEVLKEFTLESKSHLFAFWEVVKNYCESWGIVYDSVH